MATAESQMLSAERDEEARYRKVQEQRTVPLQKSKALLFAALGDDSWRVRKQAVEVLLAARPDKEVIQQLIVLMRDEDNAGLRNATAELLVRVGAEVVPVLLDHLCDPDHDLRKLVVDALGILGGPDARQGLLQALSDPDCNVAAAAAEGLGISGSEDDVPELLRHLEQNQESFFRFNALATLGRIGVAGPLPGVIRQLADQDILRRAVYECLGRIGGDLEAVELLLEGAVSHLPSIRQAAVLSLAKVLHQLDGADQETAKGRLRSTKDQGLMEQLSALFDTNAQPLKEAVVGILTVMADPCGAGVLFQSLTDERLAVAAQQGIRALGDQAVVAAIEHFSKTEVSAERAAVCSFLGGYGDSRAVATIRLGLHDGCPEVRSAAAYAAVRLGDPELPVLVAALLNDADSAVREAAFTALRSCAGTDRNLIASVARRMAQSTEFDQRKGAAQLFATLREDEQIACLMKDENALVREAATRAAGKMGQSRACPHLIMALVDEEPDVRIAAAEALGECADPTAVSPLRLSLKDGDSWVQAAALRSLVQLAGEDALPDLLVLWEQGDEVAQLACLEALEQLGSAEGLKAISRGLGCRDGEVLKGAIDLLCRHDISLLTPWMQHILSHQDWDVRITAVRACAEFANEECARLLQLTLEREDHDLVRAEIISLLGAR